VEQLDSILEAQDNLKKNLQRMAEKLDKGRGTEIAVEQGNNSPPGPDGERGPEGRKGRSGIAGIMGPQVWLLVNSFLFFCSPPSFLLPLWARPKLFGVCRARRAKGAFQA
jgi:hypothetical protein